MQKLLDRLHRLGFWPYIFLFTTLAIVISELLILVQSYWLSGTFFDRNLLIVGFITPAIDGFIIFFLMALLLRYVYTLSQEQSHLSALFDRSDIVLFKWKNAENWPVESVSKNVSALTGYSSQEYLEGTVLYSNLIHLDDLPIVTAEVIDAIDTHTDFFTHQPYRIITRDGDERWVLDRTLPIRDGNDQITHFVGFLTDITDVTLKDKQLLESELRWKFAIEGSGDGLWEWNVQTHEVYFSRQWKMMLGYSDDEIQNRFDAWEQLLHPDDREPTHKHIDEFIARKSKRYMVEFRLRCKDGTYKWILARAKALKYDNDGNIVLMTGIHTDIDERKRQAEALVQAQRMANLGSWSYDIANDTLHLSEQIYRIFSINLSTVAPTYKNILHVIHPDDRKMVNDLYTRALQNHGPYKLTHRLLLKNGTIKYVIERGETLYNDKEEAVIIRGTIQDITQQHETQLALVEAKKSADRANKAKSNFLANMSHEIRTPLNGIIGLTKRLESTPINPKQRDYLDKILYSSESLLHIINDILDYSKVEAGKLELLMQPFSLNELLESLHDLFDFTASSKGVALRLELSDNVPDTLLGDALRLKQILTNIIGNAIKFTEKGSVTVRLTWLNKHPTPLCRFEIIDTGIGMRPEVLQNLFTEFMQADDSITRKFGGSGLGLAITKKLVDLMNGTISATSREHIGTTMRVDIPLIPSRVKTSSAPSVENSLPVSFSNTRILLVEDDIINQMVAKELLESYDIHVSVAFNGIEAVHYAQTESFDMILMDLQMPEMDGFEATRRIRDIDTCKAIPIIALSAAVLPNDRELTQESGMNGHLAKPIDEREFIATLSKWLKHTTQTPTPIKHSVTNSQTSIEGIDMQALLKRLMNKSDKVAKLLELFSMEYRDFVSTCEAQKDSPEHFKKLMHTYKGTTANLSMNRLSAMAKSLENAFDQTQFVTLLKQHEQMLTDISNYLHVNPQEQIKTVAPTLSRNRLKEQCGALIDDLAVSRLVEAEQIEAIAVALNTHIGFENAQLLKKQITSFEYDDAIKTLIEIMEKL